MNLAPLEKILLRLLLGAAALLLAMFAFAWFAGGAQQRDKDSATQFVQSRVLPVLRTWNTDQLNAIVSSEFAALNAPEQLAQRITSYQKVGKLVEVQAIEVVISRPFFAGPSAQTIAYANLPARFANGSANLRLTLKRSGADWLIDTLTLQTP